MIDRIQEAAMAYAADAVRAAERESRSEAATRAFMEIVDCEAWEVRDIPPNRLEVDHAVFKPDSAVVLAGMEGNVWPIGKHKGLFWRDLPREYLQWFADLKSPYGRGSQRLQAKVRKYLSLKRQAAVKSHSGSPS